MVLTPGGMELECPNIGHVKLYLPQEQMILGGKSTREPGPQDFIKSFLNLNVSQFYFPLNFFIIFLYNIFSIVSILSINI